MKSKSINHAKRAHAILSASGSARWLACTPSAKLEEEFGEKTESPYAAEGTLAHEFAELCLRHDVLENISENDFQNALAELMSSEYFSEDMPDYIETYTDYCAQQLKAAQVDNPFATMELEARLDLTEYVPESFGTCDCAVISEPMLEVIDLKYGKGVPVYAEWNKQLMLYALGALSKYGLMYDFTMVRLTIVQPRINNVSSFDISVEELLNWAETEVKPKALLAIDGKGELVAGDHCKFCSVKNMCHKLYEKQMEIAKYEFKAPDFLSDEEISDILKRSKAFTEWLNSVVNYAQEKAVSGEKQWPGFKLVEGTSRRTWLSEDAVVCAIHSRLPEISDDQIYDTKLKGITDLEKIVGKKRFTEVLSDVVIKPAGKPSLVPEDDKRPSIGFQQAVKDFA